MRLLRSPGGCPWDAEQTHRSIRRNFLEETYEALDALDRDDPVDMCEELGDVLMQVVFHATIEEERGRFTMADVVDGVAQKMVYRHPHVFGTVHVDNSDQVLVNWEKLKRTEKGQASTADAIEAVPHTLPALWRAEKVQKKAAKAGFDWTTPSALWTSWRRRCGSSVPPWNPAKRRRTPTVSGRSWGMCCSWLPRSAR